MDKLESGMNVNLKKDEKRELLIKLLEGTSRQNVDKDMAVIGMSGRYPLAETLDGFWENLKQGKDCITGIPPERWDWREYYDPGLSRAGKMYSKWGGFIRDVDKFDPMFFNILPAEAENMDPQERLFLEIVWSLLEDAGYTGNELTRDDKKIGVFVGIMNSNYEWIGGEEWAKGNISIATSSYWSAANRVSYLLDFEGPSLAVDTACSSSLTALHLACESIKRGECHTAIVGGVNLILHPKHYARLSAINMLSKGDRCKSFGSGADGFVGGEGVGAVLLKPLEAAIAAGDQVYGVIKGSLLNAGGKTSGYTVPNPNAQGDLIARVLKKTGIDPRTISYMEAHGTGTSLGDPIEIAGLTNAYGRYTRDQQYCSIGSVKSNIGHLESAAGIAGLTKVLLQMKYKQLVPSLHSEEPNPHIDFKNSPFYIQHQAAPWEKPVIKENGEEKTYPRRAGLSSFGAGGANAHIILEEYETPKPPVHQDPPEPAVIVLSARDEERLKVYAQQIVEFLTRSGCTPFTLADTAYTLQMGREAMEERLALVVSNTGELVEKLNRYIQGKAGTEHFYTGNIKEKEEAPAALTGIKTGEELNHLARDRELEKLARLWVSGLEPDWRLLYPPGSPRRISLPTYPFARERYWIAKSGKKTGILNNLPGQPPQLHPLLDRNTSDLEEQRFTTLLAGDEFYLTDHVIQGRKVLPGAACLEMARAAGDIAARKKVRAIRNIAWAKPVVVENPREIHISLYPHQDTVEFEINSSGEADRRIVHARGNLHFGNDTPDKARAGTQSIDIEDIKTRCPKLLKGDDCYRLFQEKGLNYGPNFQSIRMIWANETEALSLIELSPACREGFDAFGLHPVLIDGALQTVVGLVSTGPAAGLHLPFGIGAVNLKKPLPGKCYAYAVYPGNDEYLSASPGTVRTSPAGETGGTPLKKFNIRVLDEAGEVLVGIKDFSIREFRQPEAQRVPGKEDVEMLEVLKQFKSKKLNFSEASRRLEKLLAEQPI